MTYEEYSMEVSNYKPFTTYYTDLSIAEHFGENAIRDTVKRAIKYKINDDYIIELCITLNHKCWIHYGQGNEKLSRLYADLYYEVRDWCFENFKGETLSKFIRLTD